jgi:hypothetical protein
VTRTRNLARFCRLILRDAKPIALLLAAYAAIPTVGWAIGYALALPTHKGRVVVGAIVLLVPVAILGVLGMGISLHRYVRRTWRRAQL